MRNAMASLLAACLLAISMVILSAAPAAAVEPHECGVKSASFARTCHPSAHVRCFKAAERGVAGVTKQKCEKRRDACRTCLGNLNTCIKRIGKWPKLTHTCDKCKARFSSCYDRRYPN